MGGPTRELHRLLTDPHELDNPATECPDTAAELQATLEGWIRQMIQKNGLDEDPLVTNGPTLGAKWIEWVKIHGYW